MLNNSKDLNTEQVSFDPFAPFELSAPSTEAQREIFTSVELGGLSANCAYNESVSLHFKGKIDPIKMNQSFQLILQRFDSLRAKFSEDGLSIIITEQITNEINILDFTNLSISEQDRLVSAANQEEVLAAFDLNNGPLIRAKLLLLAEDKSVLIITAHHIICDGWSLSLLIQDLSKYYSALVNGISIQLPKVHSFVDYAVMQDRYQKSISCGATENFWINQYKNDTPVLEFPTDKQRPALRTFNARRLDIKVPTDLVLNLRELSKKLGTSFVTLLLASFETYLHKVTRQEDIIIGLPAAGQNIDGIYNLVGHCVNLLPLRTKVDGNLAFNEYLKLRRTYIFDAFDNQQFTFGSLIRKLNIARDPSRIPLVPIIFNVDIGFSDTFKFEGLTFEFSSNPRFYENFEMFLNASGSGDNLILECTFNTDLFTEESIHDRMEQFIGLIKNIIEDPQKPIKLLHANSITDLEIFSKVNNTSKNYSNNSSLYDLFKTSTLLYPDLIAIATTEKQYSYREANYHIERIAGLLQQKGAKQGDFIAVCSHRITELPILLLAIMACGAAYVPLDPSFPLERRKMMLEDSNANLLLTAEEFSEELANKNITQIILDTEFLNNSNGVSFNPTPFVEDQLAYVLFTSGSTGRPKGVKIKHQSVINLLEDLSVKLEIKSGDQFLAITTISFDISVLEIFLPLITGATVHIATKEQGMDPFWMEKYISTKNISFLQATPATWELLYSAGWKSCSSLNVLCGGEALKSSLAIKLLSGNKSVWNLYGPTETTIWSTIKNVTFEDVRNSKNGIISIGKPVANTYIYIVDNFGNPLPLGVVGELWIGGDGVASGYVLNQELNAEKFIQNPWDTGTIYKTGDSVMIDRKGELYFFSRNDHQVKIRGFRIELGEIETAINNLEVVQQAVVIARTNSTGANYLAAYIILKPGISELNEQIKIEFKKELSKTLPDYMIPFTWIQMEKFPLTPNDKIDRKALTEIIQEENSKSSTHDFTPTELIIANLWKTLLETDAIFSNSDFFELGGHSLLAVKLMVDLEKITGIKLPLAVLFTNSTIEKLAKLYESPTEDKLWNPLTIIKESGNRRPLYFAHGISGNIFKYHMLANILNPDQPSYGLQAVGLNGLDEPFTSMEEMAAHHIKDLLAFQPKGPYALAGGSFGGYLAYEMAQQMTAMGHQIDFLCLLDIEAADQLEFLPGGIKQIKRAQLLTERIIKRAVTFIKSDKETKQTYIQNKLKERKKTNEVESWLDKYKVSEMIGEESAAYFKKVEAACYEALMSYKIKPYNGNVILIRAKEGYFNNTFDNDLGWKHFVKGNLDVQFVSGDHNSIFWEPNVYDLADKMNELLEKYISIKK